MKVKQQIIKLILLLMIIALPLQVYGDSVSSSINKTSIEVGSKAIITVSVPSKNGMLQFDVSYSSNLRVSGADMEGTKVVAMTDGKTQLVVEGIKAGKGTVTISGFGAVDLENRLPFNRTFSINVVEKPKAPKPKPEKPQPRPPQIDDTEREKAQSQQQKTPEELEREELERRMKTPLIKEIKILSNSERLKGEVLNTIEPELEKFEYSITLPWNIDQVALDISTIKEDVKLDYEKEVTLDPDK